MNIAGDMMHGTDADAMRAGGHLADTACKVRIIVPCRRRDTFVPAFDTLLPVTQEDMDLGGEKNASDDLGTYGDLAALFWTWRNKISDYIGFFHHDDYLILEPDVSMYAHRYVYKYMRTQTQDSLGRSHRDYLDEITSSDLGLSDGSHILKTIGNDALLVSRRVDLSRDGQTVREHYISQYADGKDDIALLSNAIAAVSPQMQEAAEEYLDGNLLCPSDVFIMRKDLLSVYCRWVLSVLDDIMVQAGSDRIGSDRLGSCLLGMFRIWVERQRVATVGEYPEMTFSVTNRHDPVEPAFDDQEIPIVFACNETYAPYCAAAIQSIMMTSSRSSRYDIVIMEGDLSDETESMFSSMATKRRNFSIRFVDASYYARRYDLRMTSRAGEEPYFKLVIPEVFASFDKLICLDCDVIVRSDIADLFSVDLGDDLIAAAVDIFSASDVNGGDPSLMPYIKARLHMDDPLQCFGMGVMLVNNVRFRERFTMRYLFEFAEVCAFDYQDRDVLNALCKGHILALPQEWDLLIDHGFRHRARMQEFAPKALLSDYLEASRHPRIIHYVGAGKPLTLETWESVGSFWIAFRKTPFFRRFRDERRQQERESPQRPHTARSALHSVARSMFPPETARGRALRKAYVSIRHLRHRS